MQTADVTGAGPIAARTREDPDLTARIRARDPAALERVVDTYLPQIHRAARGAGLDSQEAEDVTQATFTTFLEAAARFEGRSRVRTWLFGILYNKLAEMRRARQRDQQMDTIDETFERRFDANGRWRQPPLPVDVSLHHQAVAHEIFVCLDAAPPRQALVFVLREVEELSSEEICNVMGISGTHLRVMLHRARNFVRECLEAKGVRR